MDPIQVSNYYPTEEDQKLQRQIMLRAWQERIYRFFYNIWPAVNRILSFLFYHLLRIIKGFFKVALESIKGGS